MGSPSLLPYVGTDQAVEDLEAFRVAVGSPRVWLYGESYGTQYAQEYAAAHGAALEGLLLDGTVDLTLSGPDYWIEAAARIRADPAEGRSPRATAGPAAGRTRAAAPPTSTTTSRSDSKDRRSACGSPCRRAVPNGGR